MKAGDRRVWAFDKFPQPVCVPKLRWQRAAGFRKERNVTGSKKKSRLPSFPVPHLQAHVCETKKQVFPNRTSDIYSPE